jgi:periplasmic copper chaperone A
MSRMFAAAVLALALATGAASTPAFAHDVTVGSLTLTDLWTRATPPKALSAGGFLTITNNGDQPDRLIAASSPVAETVQLHTMSVKNGVMTMHAVEGGIEIPAHGKVALAPGGFHIMFITLKDGLAEGGQVPVTLTFEKAGSVDTFLHIMAIGAKGPSAEEMPGMGDGQMQMPMDNGQMPGGGQ